MLIANLVEPGPDVLHIVEIFDRSLFAGGDDQPLLAQHKRNLGDFLYLHQLLRRLRPYIDKCT